MARYEVNDAAVARARELIDGRQYVLDSDWGEVQPNAGAGNAYRAAIDVYRRGRRHRGVTPLDSANSSDPALVTTPPSVEQISDVWEVRKARDKLPDQDRELIRLQHYAEPTHTEIADELAIPLGTVKSRSFRAHRRLAGLLGHLRLESSPPTATHEAGSRPETRPDEKGGGSDERR
jgi:Sigma-70, region 4